MGSELEIGFLETTAQLNLGDLALANAAIAKGVGQDQVFVEG
jgi:hypothetical protein